ncbi:MAG TPA: SCO family protein [Clostridia bacterium]|nr:SCO family protein [Clostridia bacterium]
MFKRRACLPVLAILTLLLLTSVACSRKPKAQPRQYDIFGKVVSVEKASKQVTVAHKEIPGFMKAMTMSFKVKDEWALNVLEPGDEIGAVLVVDRDGAYLEQLSIQKNSGTQPEPAAKQGVRESQVGDIIPDFVLVSQDGKSIRMHQFRGRPLLLTFIYTRCPLPDYCIRMSNNFAEIASQLKQQQPDLYSHLQMLSISIDPEFDKPEVLRQYAASYAGEVDPKLTHWTFAGGTPDQVRRIAEFFGLSYLKENAQIVHSLRTVLTDSQGKVTAVYRGNEWKPADVIADLSREVVAEASRTKK